MRHTWFKKNMSSRQFRVYLASLLKPSECLKGYASVISLFIVLPIFGFVSDEGLIEVGRLADRFARPITLLGITSGRSVSTLSATHPGTFVLLSPGRESVSGSNVVYLQSSLGEKTLRHLGESEHFDIVYIDKVSSNMISASYAQVLQLLGEHVFVSISDQLPAAIRALKASGFTLVKQCSDGHWLYYAFHEIRYLKRTNWLEQPANHLHCREISSTFTNKTLHKDKDDEKSESDWISGINYMTFKMLNGRYPIPMTLEKEIIRLSKIDHPDWSPNNIVVQGRNLALIDFERSWDGKAKSVHDEGMLNLMIKFANEENPVRARSVFNEILYYNYRAIHVLPKLKTRRKTI